MAEEEGGTSNIRVICRFRPVNDKEKQMFADSQCVEFPNDNQTVVINPQFDQGGPHRFVFDHVFTPAASQESVYNIAAKPIVEAVLQGFNGTVFAYGQTSSGKTFTMTGPDLSSSELMGVIPRMVSTVFNKIIEADSKLEFQVKVGYCEIYLEKIKDLIDTTKVNLKVHEDRTRGVYIADLTEEYVSSESEVYNLMKIGTSNREVGYTHMNAGSSRSHSIFIITITQTNSSDYSAKTGKLYLVDLAGSEKVGKTGAAGKRLEEAKNINKSLTMLGSVITALTDAKSSHVPYRDSKLTRVLQDSLGGNSKTSLIVTCSPSPFNEAETISTLRFGVRAKAIKNKPKVNREYTLNELKLLLAKANEEIIKKDRIISSMKKALESSGVPCNAIEEEKLKTEDDESHEESKNNDIYDEVLIELEDLRVKLSEQTLISFKQKSHIDHLTSENEQMKNDHEFLYKQITTLQTKMAQNEENLQDKEETIEKLMITNDSLKNDLSSEIDQKIALQNQLNSRDTELEAHKNLTINTLSEENQKISEKFEEEVKKNKKLLDEIDRIEGVLRNTINTNDDKRLQALEISHKQEKERWLEEKKNLSKEITNRNNKIVELRLNLDSEAEKYKALENTMSVGERALKKRSDQLERNLEPLNLMYHQLVSQKSMLKVDKQVSERKITRLNEKIKTLEKNLKEANEKLAKSEEEKNSLRQEIDAYNNLSKRLTMGPGVINNNKIKKIIKGGSDNTIFKTPGRKINSVIPDISYEDSDTQDY
jgi:kinesin family member 5